MYACICVCMCVNVCVRLCMYVRFEMPPKYVSWPRWLCPHLILKSFLCLCFSKIWQNQCYHGKNERHMIKRIYHSYSCIIKFNEPCFEKRKCSASLALYRCFSTRLINSIKHEHTCTIKHEHTCKIICLLRSSTYKLRIFCKSTKDSKDQETINQVPVLT